MEWEQSFFTAAAALATLAAPLVAWILPAVGRARRTQEAATLHHRAALVRDLLEIHKTQPLDEPARADVSKELSSVLAELRESLPGPAELRKVGDFPWFRRWLLNLPLKSVAAKVSRLLFYLLAGMALLAAAFSAGDLSFEMLAVVSFYFLLALLFRWFAVRNHDADVRRLSRLQ